MIEKHMLYLWSKDNKDYGYRQGMNEILGMVVYAFFIEALHKGGSQLENITDFSKPITATQVKSLTDNQITHYIFNTNYIYADIGASKGDDEDDDHPSPCPVLEAWNLRLAWTFIT